MSPNGNPTRDANDGSDRSRANGSETADRHAERERLVSQLVESGRIERDSTAEALRTVPRHEFVSPSHRGAAYADRPLPIGENQTISAPHMVGRMCDLLALSPTDRVLEIGTGCGYHAAVTAELAGEVESVEYHANLAQEARERLEDLGYETVSIHVGDGHEGLPEGAPYDAAYLTCAASKIPDAIVEQVRPEGRIVAPIETGSILRGSRQRLVRARKRADGSLSYERHEGVRFVRMRGPD